MLPNLFVSKRENKMMFDNDELIMNALANNCLIRYKLFTDKNYMYSIINLTSWTISHQKAICWYADLQEFDERQTKINDQ